MGLREVLSALQETGAVRVEPMSSFEGVDWPAIAAQLAQMDAVMRQNLAGEAPAFEPAVGVWAAVTLYRACQFFVFRDADATAIEQGLPPQVPPGLVREDAPVAAVWYSADVVLQFLPDLYDLARHTAADDPLLPALQNLGRAWPLSSVGMPGIEPVPVGAAIDAIANDASLRQLYADRILAKNDFTRLADSRIEYAVRAAIGAFPELAPRAAEALGMA